MSESIVPGLMVKHKIIGPDCIKVHGSRAAAFNLVIGELLASYLDMAARPDNERAAFHIALTVKRPSP